MTTVVAEFLYCISSRSVSARQSLHFTAKNHVNTSITIASFVIRLLVYCLLQYEETELLVRTGTQTKLPAYLNCDRKFFPLN